MINKIAMFKTIITFLLFLNVVIFSSLSPQTIGLLVICVMLTSLLSVLFYIIYDYFLGD